MQRKAVEEEQFQGRSQDGNLSHLLRSWGQTLGGYRGGLAVKKHGFAVAAKDILREKGPRWDESPWVLPSSGDLARGPGSGQLLVCFCNDAHIHARSGGGLIVSILPVTIAGWFSHTSPSLSKKGSKVKEISPLKRPRCVNNTCTYLFIIKVDFL